FLNSPAHSATSRSGVALRVRGRHWASCPRSIRPARCSTRRCLETAGPLISKGAEISLTEAAPRESRTRMARLVGSARAKNVELRVSEAGRIAQWFIVLNLLVI